MMIYIGKKYIKKVYHKVKHKFKKANSKTITNDDLYKIVLLNTNQQVEERNNYINMLFWVFIILCGVYLYKTS